MKACSKATNAKAQANHALSRNTAASASRMTGFFQERSFSSVSARKIFARVCTNSFSSCLMPERASARVPSAFTVRPPRAQRRSNQETGNAGAQHYMQRIVVAGLLGSFARLLKAAANSRTKLGGFVPGGATPFFGARGGGAAKLLCVRPRGRQEFTEPVFGAAMSRLFQDLAGLADRGIRVSGDHADLHRRSLQIGFADSTHGNRPRRGSAIFGITLAHIVHRKNSSTREHTNNFLLRCRIRRECLKGISREFERSWGADCTVWDEAGLCGTRTLARA